MQGNGMNGQWTPEQIAQWQAAQGMTPEQAAQWQAMQGMTPEQAAQWQAMQQGAAPTGPWQNTLPPDQTGVWQPPRFSSGLKPVILRAADSACWRNCQRNCTFI